MNDSWAEIMRSVELPGDKIITFGDVARMEISENGDRITIECNGAGIPAVETLNGVRFNAIKATVRIGEAPFIFHAPKMKEWTLNDLSNMTHSPTTLTFRAVDGDYSNRRIMNDIIDAMREHKYITCYRQECIWRH
jgi:hypothetical protein